MAPPALRKAGDGVLKVFPDLRFTRKDVYNGISLLLLALAVYACLFLAIGKPFLPTGGPAWAIIFIWFTALVLGMALDRVQIPGPLGMIAAGMILRNVQNGQVIAGLRPSWTKEFRGMALAIIFLRSGLELELGIFKRVGPAAVRLLLIPGVVEAFFDGGLAIALFGMPATFAFALGFILKAVGPALVIQCMFEVQQRRLGLEKAIPATVVAAASFDDAIAITGYTIFISIAVTGEGNQVWDILHGPLSIIFGILAGLGFALLCGPTKLWSNAYKRTSAVFLSALIMKFFFDLFSLTSGGAMGSLTLGLVIKEIWARGWPRWAHAEGETGPHLTRSVEKHVRWFWRIVMCPILFGLIGTSINFKALAPTVIPNSVAIIFAGLAVRLLVSFLVMFRAGFTFKEKLFFAFAWTPKATVQATLAALPQDQVNRVIPRSSPRYAEYSQWAQEALVTGIFCILICGSVGTLLIRWFAPRLLDKSPEPEEGGSDASGGERHAHAAEDPLALQQMGRQMSGRYKNPSIDHVHPFGIEGRPAHPLASAESEAAARQEKAALRAHNSLLAGVLEHFETIAEEVDGKAAAKDDAYLEATAGRLRYNVRNLRQRLLEETGVQQPHAQDVEGQNAFLRASDNLRHRHHSHASDSGGLPQSAGPSAKGPFDP